MANFFEEAQKCLKQRNYNFQTGTEDWNLVIPLRTLGDERNCKMFLGIAQTNAGILLYPMVEFDHPRMKSAMLIMEDFFAVKGKPASLKRVGAGYQIPNTTVTSLINLIDWMFVRVQQATAPSDYIKPKFFK